MEFDNEEHQANDFILKSCDFCGEQAELKEGVCEQCRVLREEAKKQIDKLGI